MNAVALMPFVLTALTVAAPAPQRNAGPSFSCASAATAIEKAICGDPALAAQDRTMAQLFGIAKRGAFGSGASNQLAAQRTALQEMRACVGPRASQPLATCLNTHYAVRNQELAIAALLAAPAEALPVLRAGDPAFAPILEAVQRWAEAPANANWSAPERARSRARIATLLQPYLTALQTNADRSFGNAILSDPSGDGVAVRTIDDLFRSDRHFAAFLNVLGPYLDAPKRPGMPRDLPCAAIVRHPQLLAANGPVFGSTMDNFVLRNDCGDSLPPLPALDALVKKLHAHWPPCEGTIRFAIYSGFSQDVDRARLGMATASNAKALPKRKGIGPADLAAAERALAAYYGANLHVSPIAAAKMARDALLPILEGAHACD